jgi:hypothetical protein
MVSSELLSLAHDILVPISSGLIVAYLSFAAIHRAIKKRNSYNDP